MRKYLSVLLMVNIFTAAKGNGPLASGSIRFSSSDRGNTKVWKINAPSKKVKLEFVEFDFEDCNICSECDKLSLIVADKQYGDLYCGQHRPHDITVYSSDITIKFEYSRNILQLSQFSLDWTSVAACGEGQFECWNDECIDEQLVCDVIKHCSDGSDEARCDYHKNKCGLQQVQPIFNFAQRIVGGVVSEPHSWPWVAMLVEGNTQFCGAAVVTSRYILTAAHCVNAHWRSKTVFVGRHHLSGDSKSEQRLLVEESKIHPYYEPNTLDYDIALLRVSEEINFNKFVQPICMTSLKSLMTNCFAVGWGQLSYGGGRQPENLHQVLLPVVTNSECRMRYMYQASIREFHVCAGQQGRDTCQLFLRSIRVISQVFIQ